MANDKGPDPTLEGFWQRWADYYGESGLVNPRGDRLLTELSVRAIHELRPRLLMVNYQDCDYVHWGWTYRMMQQTALKAWWRTTPFERAPRVHDGFHGFVAGDRLTRAHVRWPGLIAQPGLVREFRAARVQSGGRPWRLLARGIFSIIGVRWPGSTSLSSNCPGCASCRLRSTIPDRISWAPQ